MTQFPADPADAQKLIDACPLLASVRGASLGLSTPDMGAVAAALQELIRDLYVHLPLKRSALAIDPVQDLAVLADDVRFGLSEAMFVHRLEHTVNRLRDRHTSLELPWGDAVAFVPLAVEAAWDGPQQVLVVTKIVGDPDAPGLVPGARITHWNGVPVDVWVLRLADETNGANPAARVAIALRSLTSRPLAYQERPDEDWVTLTYISPTGGFGTATLPWRVYSPPVRQQPAEAADLGDGSAFALGVDRATRAVNHSWLQLFGRATGRMAQRRRAAAAPEGFELSALHPVDGLPSVAAGTVTLDQHDYGYIRIYSFDAPDVPGWATAMATLLKAAPSSGLIVDVRANPGGAIPAAEALLGMLTARTVLPAPVEFRITDTTAGIVNGTKWFLPWRRSMAVRYDTGETFTQGYPLIDPAAARDHLGVYAAPAILINDALSYSATDFLSAGWQDNGIGPIIGVDGLSGAGGANVWSYDQIRSLLGPKTTLPPTLPGGFGVNVSARRATRVLANHDLPIEGLGVRADLVYHMSLDDVLGDNADLIAFAARTLSTAPRS